MSYRRAARIEGRERELAMRKLLDHMRGLSDEEMALAFFDPDAGDFRPVEEIDRRIGLPSDLAEAATGHPSTPDERGAAGDRLAELFLRPRLTGVRREISKLKGE